ncbi:MAG: hypothetical protein ACYTDW_19380, partial [Planctomycetota bacterium]
MKLTKGTNRRELLKTIGAMPVIGSLLSQSAKAKSQDKVDAVTGPTYVTRSDKLEYARLKKLDLNDPKLDLNDPKIVARQKKMPVGKIGNLTLGRIISGSNLISMNMHARDLDYVRALAAHYNTEERIFMTLKLCEEYGINSAVLKNHNFKQF